MIEKIRPEVEGREVESRETGTGGVEDREVGTLPDGRYLLFDSGCATCTDVARSVEPETGDWLTARSLHEEEVQKQLSKARPDWKWEPGLLEIEGDRALLFTGLQMKMRLLVGLGPRKAARIAKIARRAGAGELDLEMDLSPSDEDPGRYKIDSIKHIDRRTALKRMVSFGIGAALLSAAPGTALAQEAAAGDDKGKAKIVVRKRNMTRRRALAAFAEARRDKKGGALHRHLGGRRFKPDSNDVVGGFVYVEKIVNGNTTLKEKTWFVKVNYRNEGSRERATFAFMLTKETIVAGSVEMVDRKVRCDHSIFTRGGGLDTYAVKDGRVGRVKRVKKLDDLRRSMKTASSSGTVLPRSNCTGCTLIAGAVIGLGCTPYLTFIIAVACGPVASTFCYTATLIIQGILCGVTTGLTAIAICSEAGYC